MGPFLETGGEDGPIEEVKLGLCSTAGGGSKPGSVVLSRLLDRTLGDVRVVVVELIERRSCQGVDVGESGLGPYKTVCLGDLRAKQSMMLLHSDGKPAHPASNNNEEGLVLGGGDYTGDRIILCRPATQASGGLWVHTSCTYDRYGADCGARTAVKYVQCIISHSLL